jgi:NADH-quinone oxidoreductase subunit K
MTVQPSAYLFLSAILFGIGAVGVVARKNVLVILMSVELMLNVLHVADVAAGWIIADPAGGIFAFLVITVAAAEAAVGLALLIALFRLKETLDITELKVLKW